MQKWIEYQAMPGTTGLRKVEDRRKFIESDFKDATVLDLGCWAGQMMMEAKRMGAKNVIGIDADTSAIEIGKKYGNEIYANDLNNPLFLRTLGNYDVVLLLSILGNLERPEDVLQSASTIAKNVLYVEGHGSYHQFKREDWVDMFLRLTNFRTIEYLGETPDRSLFRLANAERTIEYIKSKKYKRIGIIGKPGAGKTYIAGKFEGYKVYTDEEGISPEGKYIIDSHGALTIAPVDVVIHVVTDEQTRKERILTRKYEEKCGMDGEGAYEAFKYTYSPHYIKGDYDYFMITN